MLTIHAMRASLNGLGRRRAHGRCRRVAAPAFWHAWIVCCCVVFAAALPRSTQADNTPGQASAIQSIDWQLGPDGMVRVSAQLELAISQPMRDALQQGIPVHFVAQARLVRKRWWVVERTDAQVHRYWRLSYQPLTRVWRVHATQQAPTGDDLALGLAQSFAELNDALRLMERIGPWEVADAQQLASGKAYSAQFSFAVDQQQLPRPLLFDAAERAGWDIQLSNRQTLRLPSPD